MNSDTAFAKAQRAWDNATPPESPECEWHPWDEDTMGPIPDECPECLAMEEDYRESQEDDRRHGIY